MVSANWLFLHFRVEALIHISLFGVDKPHVQLWFAFNHLVVIHEKHFFVCLFVFWQQQMKQMLFKDYCTN